MDTKYLTQGSAEWLRCRMGMVTASRMKDVMSVLKKGGESESRNRYKWELVSERLSGTTTDKYMSTDMMRGAEVEPFARAAYEVETGNTVDQLGFIVNPKFDFAGASPDGLIGQDGALEIKVPRVYNHLRWMHVGVVPEEHQLQCLWVMACAERAWCDFVSYCPELPENLQLFVVRMERDQNRIDEINAEVEKFNTEVETLIASLNKER